MSTWQTDIYDQSIEDLPSSCINASVLLRYIQAQRIEGRKGRVVKQPFDCSYVVRRNTTQQTEETGWPQDQRLKTESQFSISTD